MNDAVKEEGKNESFHWKTEYTLEKRQEDITQYRGGREKEFFAKFKPYEVLKGKDNCAVKGGVYQIWCILGQFGWTPGAGCFGYSGTGGAGKMGVGDSATAAAFSQTALQGSNKEYVDFDSDCVPVLADGSNTWVASFGATKANFAWNEWAICYGAGTMLLNRKVASLGTKSGGTWTLTVKLSIA